MSGLHPLHVKTATGSAAAEDVLRGLIPLATHLVVSQLDAFSSRLSNAFLAMSEQSMDSREANLSFNAGQILKKNAYAFYHLSSADVEKAFRQEVDLLISPKQSGNRVSTAPDADLSLISYEEMDKKLALSRVSRTIELDSAEQYAALNMRLSHLLGRETLSIAQNPFRPDILLNALYSAWCQFDPEVGTHEMVLPLLRADILFDLEPILYEINSALVKKGILPDLQDSYKIRRNQNKTSTAVDDETEAKNAEQESHSQDIAQKLKRYFSGAQHQQQAPRSNGNYSDHPGFTSNPAESRLFQHLAEFQQNLKLNQMMSGAGEVMRLSQMREHVADVATTGVEKHTLDLLSQVFDNVFRNQAIPAPVKELISVLQVPVLKAALIDKEFFFKDQHPARRLIDLLSRYSLSLDQNKGAQDPLFQTMKRNVERVSQEFDQEIALFDEVVTDLESFIEKEEQANAQALEAPIKSAIRKEKIKQASIHANQEVAIRVGSGEVVAFVETFLESRWIKVLTLAYSVRDEKPHAVQDAIKTMDDLIWSVKPKFTLQDRQELLNRLPAILARLNKWLSLIKWEDADRVQFFAELSECHASIVRAPLELSPDRQLELAVEAAQQATERRLEKRAEAEKNASQEELTTDDEFVDVVHQLERGIWIEFTQENAQIARVRLAWVSPMRSLYIFTASEKEKSFSVSAKNLEQAFREKRAQILQLDKVVDRALQEALATLPDSPDAQLEGEPAA
ncbi:DUF1631 family protein [Undibacterium sp. 14-3-2]|uniref:DUF1631 family protein n=1 Tax=Undibacterium sp. 14-3-2 TaxID=2800129 RepID=UPI001903C188|nr:DUF1631 family protein [Undibacterium sp. 14-3-2]MBK1889094.1 DUF1631 family protein [Undibacterium sp. 14-3-2]